MQTDISELKIPKKKGEEEKMQKDIWEKIPEISNFPFALASKKDCGFVLRHSGTHALYLVVTSATMRLLGLENFRVDRFKEQLQKLRLDDDWYEFSIGLGAVSNQKLPSSQPASQPAIEPPNHQSSIHPFIRSPTLKNGYLMDVCRFGAMPASKPGSFLLSLDCLQAFPKWSRFTFSSIKIHLHHHPK